MKAIVPAVLALLCCTGLPPAAAAAEAPGERPRIGLVLSGGGARGGAHLGVLKVLEELRVPVDVIVGTSAGAIVGAAYASGMPLADIEAEAAGFRTAQLFHDVARSDLAVQQKAEERDNFIGPEIGIGPHGIMLPKGAVAGVSLEAVLRRLTQRQRDDSFDALPIPFRAVATDLASAQMVVLERGSLATAVRASMAIPAIVSPVERDGRLLVDGGVSRNLPVDVARAMGAQTIIAVNIGSPLLPREELTSLLKVSEQMVRVLTAQNTTVSLSQLGAADILISPALGDIATADFDRTVEAAAAGEAAARAVAGALRAHAVEKSHFAAMQLARTGGAAQHPIIDGLRITGTERIAQANVAAALTSRPGQAFDPARADADVRRLYASGEFERINYYLDRDELGRHILTTEVGEKSWGPDYLRFGFGLSSDLRGDAQFNLLLAHRRADLNSLGAQWRNRVQIGRVERLATELYQPFNHGQWLFGVLRAHLTREPFDLYLRGERIGRYRRIASEAGAEVGIRIGQAGELRLGVTKGHVRMGDDTALLRAGQFLPSGDTGGLVARARIDTLDNIRFPRSGFALDAGYLRARSSDSQPDGYSKFDASLQAAVSEGSHTVRVAASATHLRHGPRRPALELSELGGFLRLSGYRTGEFAGTEPRLARLVYTYRLTPSSLLDGMFVGISTEAGRIREVLDNPVARGTLRSNALFIGAGTPLGPLYLGYGRAAGGRDALYIFLGVP